MASVSNGCMQLKSLKLSADDEVFVGLDVHKRSVSAAIAVNEVIIMTWQMPYDVGRIVEKLQCLASRIKLVVYEAGPTGFSLARRLHSGGIPVEVVAPGKVPRPPTRCSKSDGMDCRKLAIYAAKGLLTTIAIPGEEEEAERQVLRLRHQVVCKLRRIKTQIKFFLMQFGIAEPEGLATWSVDSVERLCRMELPADLRFCLDRYLDQLEDIKRQLRIIGSRCRGIASRRKHADAVAILRSHPGVGQTVALSVRTELFRPERFASARQVTSYLGLAPMISQSGEVRKERGILKTGRGSLRGLLIEASWQWIRRDPWARMIYKRLVSNTGSALKAIVAMARRMACNLWHMMVRGQDYRPQTV